MGARCENKISVLRSGGREKTFLHRLRKLHIFFDTLVFHKHQMQPGIMDRRRGTVAKQ
jgi:hypothetical protein